MQFLVGARTFCAAASSPQELKRKRSRSAEVSGCSVQMSRTLVCLILPFDNQILPDLDGKSPIKIFFSMIKIIYKSRIIHCVWTPEGNFVFVVTKDWTGTTLLFSWDDPTSAPLVSWVHFGTPGQWAQKNWKVLCLVPLIQTQAGFQHGRPQNLMMYHHFLLLKL